jgi:DNA-3-methyladenine glycosylase I
LLRFAGEETTTFCGGGAADREPTDGGCTVPESSRSAIAPAPSSSATSGTTTHRAVTQSPFPRSLADTGLSFPLAWVRPRSSSGIQETGSDGNPVSGDHAVPRRDLRSARPSLDTGHVTEPIRCWPTNDPAYIAYHDEEWGRPVLDERGLYERLCLEGFQAGLAWITILRKREAFRRGFAGFEPERVARFGERDIERLLGDAAIVRHRGKIEAAIANAQATLALRETETPLGRLMWEYRDAADGKELSKRLRTAGFRFVGPTTVYSSLEACGIVNGHRADCWVRDAVEAEHRAVPS